MEKYDDREIMEGIEVDNYGDEEEYEAHDDPDDDSPYVMPGGVASDPSWVKHGTNVPMEVPHRSYQVCLVNGLIVFDPMLQLKLSLLSSTLQQPPVNEIFRRCGVFDAMIDDDDAFLKDPTVNVFHDNTQIEFN